MRAVRSMVSSLGTASLTMIMSALVVPVGATTSAVKPLSAAERTLLRAAITQTLSAESVRVDVTWQSAGMTRYLLLKRPDQMRTETVLPDGTALSALAIGRDNYESTTSVPRRWVHSRSVRTPAGVFDATLQPWLQVDLFTHHDGDRFVGEVVSRRTRFEVRAQLRGGYVVGIDLAAVAGQKSVAPMNSRLRLSRFGQRLSITTPPVNQIDELLGPMNRRRQST